MLCGLAAASSIVPALLASDDDAYVALSALTLLYVVAIIVHVIVSAKGDARHLFRSTTDSEIRRVQIGAKISRAIDNA
jgi:hypothetical protein